MDAPQETTSENSGRARERHKKRQERQAMVVRGGSTRKTGKSRQQILPADRFKLPAVNLPVNRFLIGIPMAVIVIIGVIIALAMFKQVEPEVHPNAIWLDKSWTYAERSVDETIAYAHQLRDKRIGTVYAYVSTLNINNLWSGGQQGQGSFMQSRDTIVSFVQQFKQIYPEVQLYGWIEIWTNLDAGDGYRLDDEELQTNIADFSQRLINELGFDGIFLDVKPLFTGNEDFLKLIREIKAKVGVAVPIALAIPADLTPENSDLTPLPQIAPGTAWDEEYKQRILVSADQIVITAYQSYRDNPVDYIDWVAYQVKTYVSLLADMTTDTQILVSIPNYQAQSDAHSPSIETIAAALDGVNMGLSELDEEMEVSLYGVAIFTDRDLSDDQWNIFRDKWLNR